MFCPKCGKENPTGVKFCMNCGFGIAERVKMQPESAVSAPPENAGSVPPEGAGSAPPEKPAPAPRSNAEDVRPVTKPAGAKKPLLFALAGAAAAVVIIAVIAAVILTRPKYEVNDPSLRAVTPIPGYAAAESSSLNVCFLYPEESALRDNGSGGIYVYPSGAQGIPYIQITKSKGKSDPEKYFGEYRKKTSQEYSDAEYDDIVKAPVSDKVLYMQRARVFKDGADQVIDRYIEIYPAETVEYTVKSYAAKSEERALLAVIESLRFGSGVYDVKPSAAGSVGDSGSGGSDSGGSGSGGGAGTENETGAASETAPASGSGSDTGSGTETGSGSGSGSGTGSGSGSGSGSGGTSVPGQENYTVYQSDSGHFAVMVDMTLVQTVLQAENGLDVRLKKFADDDTADVNVRRHSFSSEGITTADQFLNAYIEEMVSEGAARPQIYDMGGGTLRFRGITSTYTDEILGQMAMYLFAADDGKGNIYTIYFENFAEDADAYTDVVNGLFVTLTPV